VVEPWAQAIPALNARRTAAIDAELMCLRMCSLLDIGANYRPLPDGGGGSAQGGGGIGWDAGTPAGVPWKTVVPPELVVKPGGVLLP
jgi:hypothetical protein